MNRFHTTQQVADLLGVSRQTVRAWISSGDLKAARLGPRTLRISAEALAEFTGAQQ